MNEKVRLHVGCGHRYLPGFVHIDQDHLEHVDHVRDIKDLSIFEDESVDEIYSCGTIIYFDRYEVRTVLKEWSRVLKKGGILRTSIADFEKMVYQRTTYDFHSLRGVLETAGFRNVRRYNWRKFLPEGYDDYSRAYIPHMDESGLHLSLNVICEKE